MNDTAPTGLPGWAKWTIGSAMAIGAALFAWDVYNNHETPEQSSRRHAAAAARADAERAKEACRDFVSDQLKAPATAKFQDLRGIVALAGKAERPGHSPAAALAIELPRYPDEGARAAALELDQQMHILTRDEYLRVRGGGNVVETVRDAMVRKFEKSDFVVAGYVDAQNTFGAMIRMQFICLVTKAQEWRLDGLLTLSR